MSLDPDRAVHALAARQDGPVQHGQCLRLGLSPGQIQHRVTTDRWRWLARGVYAVGHAPLGVRGRHLAAVFASGPEAAVSHRSAASLWGLQPHHAGPVHTTAGVSRDRRAAAALHRSRRWDPGVRTVRNGVPVTSIARTIVDLAEVGGADEVEFAIRAAERLHAFDRRLVAPIPGRRGALRLMSPPRLTRGNLEPLLVPLLRRHGLVEPEFNAPWEELYLDAAWWDAGLVLEVDDWETHRHRDAFIRDRRRGRRLQAAGLRAIQATYEDLTTGAARFAAELRDLGVPLLPVGGRG